LINLAVVGLGVWGQRHVRSARASSRFDINVAVDPSPAAAEVAGNLGLELRASLNQALEDPKIDAIALATPHSQHTQQIIEAAAAGTPVYTEKPFALNAADARAAVDAAKKAGIPLALGHDQRNYPSIQRLSEIINDGALGTISHLDTTLIHDSLLRPYQDLMADENTNYARRWRLEQDEAPAGPISQFGIHRIDTMIQLMGPIDWVIASPSSTAIDPDLIDTVSITVQFAGGQLGHLSNSIASPLYSRLQIFGTSGWAESRGPETFEDYRECSLVDLHVLKDGERTFEAFPIIDSVAANFASFADAIEGKADFIIPMEDMIHVIEVVDAIRESIAGGQRVLIKRD
jgi:predicted dehydrogenase